MSNGVRPDNWGGRSHNEVYNAAQAFNSGMVTTTSKHFADQATALHEAIMATGKQIQTIVGNEWRGQAAQAVQAAYSEFFQRAKTYSDNMTKFANALPEVGHAMDAAKSSIEPPMDKSVQTASTIQSPAGFANVAVKMAEDTKYARDQMIRLFSNPAVKTGNSTGDITDQPGGGKGDVTPYTPNGSGDNGGGDSGKNLGQTGGQIKDLSDKLGKTNPAFDRGTGDGQGAGQGQGGQGAGSGSGGGQGSGGGSGTGGGPGSGFGGGSDPRSSGAYAPAIGSTNAAGLSPSSTGTGAGTGPGAGLGGLRGALGAGGMPPGSGSTSTNPAGIGAAGMRGGMMPMGMMGGAGAHGRGGKGQDDDEKPTPSYLINVDNGNELFGESIKASPGVIGDWTENEEAEKKAREAEIRRYKSMGWDVKFD